MPHAPFPLLFLVENNTSERERGVLVDGFIRGSNEVLSVFCSKKRKQWAEGVSEPKTRKLFIELQNFIIPTNTFSPLG